MPDDEKSRSDAIDDLFVLDPAEFVAVRNELVRALRKGGDREGAARAAAIRRPSPAAWAVNQLVRRRRDDVEGLVGLGRALRDAQARALDGADAQLLRQAARARREAVATLADAAVALLAERGSGADAHAGEVVATLEAASLDAGSGEMVLAGQLPVALAPPTGLDGLDAGETTSPAPKPRVKPDGPAVDEAAEADRKDLFSRAERAVTEATELFTTMSGDADSAALRAAEREHGLREADQEVARVEVALDQARKRSEVMERELADARRVAAESQSAAADAHQRLQDAQARVDALRQ